ncbi:MAG: hypothetical protein V3T17_02360 [Pseudomonadales bacterium]
MSLPIPQLDNVEFETLVEQARARIPLYAPSWTDHNIHDPGMTLLDLVAWLVDQESFQAGFISDAHYQAFAALLGVRSQAAQPAQGLIWPPQTPVAGTMPAAGVDLALAAPAHCPEQPELGYQSARALHISAANLLALFSDGRRFDLATREQNPILVLHDSLQQRVPDTLELLFDRPLLNTATQLPLSLGFELLDLPLAEVDSAKPSRSSGSLIVDYRLEISGEPWRRLSLEEDTTHALNHSGYALFKLPDEAIALSIAAGAGVQSRLRIRTRGRINPIPARIQRLSLNVLPLVQLQTQAQAPLSRVSFGLPDESFDIALDGLPTGENIDIEVEEQGVFELWQEVDSLKTAGPADRVYALDRSRNSLSFGNGLNGRIPVKDAQIRHRAYNLCRGDEGNQIADLNWRMTGAPGLAGDVIFGSNSTAISGGEDAWTLTRLRAEAREQILQRQALLSNQQLSQAALQLPHAAVREASVLVGFHQDLTCRKLPGSRTLVITPERDPLIDALDAVPARYATHILQGLRPRQVLGEKLYVVATERIAVQVQADLLIADGEDIEAVLTLARMRLDARLTDVPNALDRCDLALDLKAGYDQLDDIEPWPAGRDLSCQEMQVLLAQTPGVLAVRTCLIARLGQAAGPEDIALSALEIAIGREHQLSAYDSSATDTDRQNNAEACYDCR